MYGFAGPGRKRKIVSVPGYAVSLTAFCTVVARKIDRRGELRHF